MKTPQHFPFDLPLDDQIIYVLLSLKKATTNEIVTELMELKGIATEDGLEDLSVDVSKELSKLLETRQIKEEFNETETVYCLPGAAEAYKTDG